MVCKGRGCAYIILYIQPLSTKHMLHNYLKECVRVVSGVLYKGVSIREGMLGRRAGQLFVVPQTPGEETSWVGTPCSLVSSPRLSVPGQIECPKESRGFLLILLYAEVSSKPPLFFFLARFSPRVDTNWYNCRGSVCGHCRVCLSPGMESGRVRSSP